MLDSRLRPLVDPVLEALAERTVPKRVSADFVTVAGFALGLIAMAAVALEHYLLGLFFLAGNRFADGLDGAIARRTKLTDLGGFLDIVLDFIIYSGIVFAFALADPPNNALTAAFLIFSFVGTGCSFLAFAIMAAKRQISTDIRGLKSLYYLGGLTEGTETILFFVLFCLFPQAFVGLALIFGAMCWLTTAGRILAAMQMLR